MPHRPTKRWKPVAATALWAAALALGTFGLNSYSLIAGPRGTAPVAMPAELGTPQTALNLVIYAHPHCPCTRATLWEAAELVAESRGRLSVQVLFYVPADEPDAWAAGDLWNIAAATPDTTPRIDRGGLLAARHGAQTSGHGRIYDASGALVFDGGLTASRGHQGPSNAEAAIRALIQAQQPDTSTTPVYGCGIANDTCAP